ncbi:FTR1 family protein [Crenobacter sp. SG2303]|uniref:FTR1 family protein n=1 Tax=Crenobacter oryzisoli TaxID=3056844 RepID=A0ABT7XM00_9NEIS|nr:MULTISPECIES: FTR1 family protein [unclassified Crenobacter]MDN0074780.1 FTR1 family protein [Crenobacter sp. SG2303]MDN0084136.1 FTR1 family protein [Crenobacter sp. SG2305]
MGQVVFVMWRESVEALLVIGILHAWLSNNAEAKGGKRYLWGGVLAGLGIAGLLAVGFFEASEFLGNAQDYFQTGMVLIAAALIVQMVFWMRKHGRTLKKELESGLTANAKQQNWWGVFVLAALAVAREGSEAVVFLYGLIAGADSSTLLTMGGGAVLGLVLAIGTYWLLQVAGSAMGWRLFFKVSEVLLLLLASAMLVNGVDRLISMDVLPALVDPVWDSSALLDDSTQLGGLVAALTGYRAHPALMTLLVWLGFWGGVTVMLKRATPAPQKKAAQA